MAIAYLSLGSNLGNKRKHIIEACAMIAERVGDILTLSDIIETEPWGYSSKHIFLNLTLQITTPLSPFDLLAYTKQIEYDLGRISKTSNQTYLDRSIDIDILLYDDCIINSSELTIPHPLMHERLFVLQPLAQIAPLLIHPVLKQTIIDLLNQLKNQ